MPFEVFFEPVENIFASEESKNTLIKIGALASAEARNIMDVYRNLPHPWERLGGAGVNLAFVGNSKIQSVGPNGLVCLAGTY